MTIIERIFSVMEQKGLKSVDLSKTLQINTSVVSSWKKRNNNPPAEYLIQICEFLGVSLNYLVEGKENTSIPLHGFLEFESISQKNDYLNKVLHLKEDTLFTRFREAREAAGVTVEDAAQGAFLKPEDILMMENDEISVADIDTVMKKLQQIGLEQYAYLAYKYNVDLFWLLCGKVRPPAAVVHKGHLAFPPYEFMIGEDQTQTAPDFADLGLDEKEEELIKAYRYLSTEGKGWAHQIILGYLKQHENLSSSRQLESRRNEGGIA